MHNFDQNLAQGSYHERVEERKTNKQTHLSCFQYKHFIRNEIDTSIV